MNIITNLIIYIKSIFLLILIILILFIALVAKYLIEEEENSESIKDYKNIVLEEKQPNILNKQQENTKTNHLLIYNENNEDKETDSNDTILGNKYKNENKETDHDTINLENKNRNEISEEEKMLIMQQNQDAFYKNKFESVYPDGNITMSELSEKEIENLQMNLAKFLSSLEEKTECSDDSSEANSDIMTIINMFYSTPLDTPLSPEAEEFKRLVESIRSGEDVVIYSPKTPEINIVDTKETSKQISPTNLSEEKAKPTEVHKPVIIVTRRVNEGDPIPPLPSWTNIEFDHKDYHIKRHRLDNMFNDDYKSSHIDHTKPSIKNQAWMETESSFNLDNLFKEESGEQKNINNKDKD